MSEQNSTQFCTYCGAEIAAGQSTCSQCGNPVRQPPAASSKLRLIRIIAAVVLCATAIALMISGGVRIKRVAAEEAEDMELAFYQTQYQECVQGIDDTNDLARRQGDPYRLKDTIISRYHELMDICQNNIDRIQSGYRSRRRGAIARGCVGVGLLAAAVVVVPKRKRER